MDHPGRRGFEARGRPPTRDEALEVVRGVVADKADIDPARLGPGTRLQADLGIDSLKSIEIVSELCSRCDIAIDEDEIVGVDTFAALVELVRDKL